MRLLIASLILLFGLAANAAEVDITWQAPTQNVDGTPLTDLAGFTVYVGESTRNYTQSVVINDPTATSAVVQVTIPLSQGDNDVYIAMTASDDDGNESAYSNEIVQTVTVVDDVPPDAPTILTLTITIGIDCPDGVTCVVQ